MIITSCWLVKTVDMSINLHNKISRKLKILVELSGKFRARAEELQNRFYLVCANSLDNDDGTNMRIELGKSNLLFEMDKLALEIQEQGNIDQEGWKRYSDIKIRLYKIVDDITQCDCGSTMSKQNNVSKLVCSNCGWEKSIISIFRTEANNTSTSKTTRPKDYSISKHCGKWLEQLQGRGVLNIKEVDYKKMVAYFKKSCSNHRGDLMVGMIKKIKCEQIRQWFKDIKLTKYNKLIPLIRRTITKELGYELKPPQFSYEEEQKILSDWERIAPVYCKIYDQVKNKKRVGRTNSPYYPICILLIVKSRWPRDHRIAGLRDCVHIQSDTTMNLRIKCWKQMCKIIGYKYVPI
jgi:hypothetical protein